MTGQRSDHGPGDGNDGRRLTDLPPEEREEEWVPGDDAVIGRALRASAVVLTIAAVVVVGVALLPDDGEDREPIVDAAVATTGSVAELAAPEPPTLRFTDVTDAWGVDFVHENGAEGERMLPETMGGGVAVLDVDADGDQDLLFVQSSVWPWSEAQPEDQQGRPLRSRIYLNDGAGGFSPGQALGTGYGMGVAVGDYDGDGLVDLYLTAVGRNRLYRNRGDGRFVDVTAATGTAGADDAWSTATTFLDHDGDGDLDLFVANYVRWSREIDFEVDYRLTGIGRAYGPPTNYEGTRPYLFRNDGPGEDGEVRFTEVAEEAGLVVLNEATGAPMAKSLAVIAQDLDGDGLVDLAVANDTVRNFLFRNLGDGRFAEIGSETGLAFDNAGHATGAMGIDAARYLNDEDLAVAIGNFANEMTSFYVAQAGSGLFTDEAIVTGVGPASRAALSFGLLFLDVDLDGRQDLFQTNGHVEDEINRVQPSQSYEQPSQLFWNCGLDCPRVFLPLADEALGDLARPVVGRGAAYGDLDGDGDLDLVITQVGRAPLVLRNDQATGNGWLRVAAPVGSTLRLTVGDVTQTRELATSRSYLSQVEAIATFGLGAATTAQRLTVTLPDGRELVREDLAAGQLIELRDAG